MKVTQTRLGILGGGQLGRMFIQEAINYNISINILDPDADAPCKHICENFTIGSLGDYQTVYNWGKNLDLITIEIEKVNIDALEDLEKKRCNCLSATQNYKINTGQRITEAIF